MRRLVVGTCGHVDHGKTSLVLSLTGIDCDRLAEEKSRGITIDLGFAHLTAGDVQLGFVDVPGHERFLHNALAGLGGIRAMLLVVAADEGVKPQTREHLDICGVLGIPAGVVALTKSDLVEPDRLAAAQAEVHHLLDGSRFAAAPVVAVSSRTGSGLERLKAALLALAGDSSAPPSMRPMRLPVDRAFHLKGRGVVVTGTLVSGRVQDGDILELQPDGGQARVRSVQVHGRAREEALAGERASLLLAGPALPDVGRGRQLVAPGSALASRSLCARFQLRSAVPALAGTVPVRVHHYSAEVGGTLRVLDRATIEPGETAIVEIRLAEPLCLVRGDRYVLRRPSPLETLGGGEVLDPAWVSVRPTERAAAVEALDGTETEVVEAWVTRAGEAGLATADIARRLGLSPAAAHALAAAGRSRLAPVGAGRTRWVSPAAYGRVATRARRVLDEFYAREGFVRGMPKATAAQRILPVRAADLAGVYLEWLETDGVLELDGDVVSLPAAESPAGRWVLERLRSAGLTPPPLPEIERELPRSVASFAALVEGLLHGGKLVQLPNQALVEASVVARVKDQLWETGWDRFTVPDFKERFGLTRKWALPILEHLDLVGATQRIGSERVVMRS